MEFTVDRHLVDGVEVIEVEGRINIITKPILRNVLLDVFVPGCAGAVIDIEAVDSLDDSGLGLLIGAYKRAQKNAVSVQFVCTHPQILEIFLVCGLTRTFGIHPSIQDAVAAIRQAHH